MLHNDRFQELNLFSLSKRRLKDDLNIVYKYLCGIQNFDSGLFDTADVITSQSWTTSDFRKAAIF